MAKVRVAIVGAGVAGLASALALKNSAAELIILERDPAPPDIPATRAFDAWPRPGVPQFRHAHVLLARLQTTIRDRHPELLAELLEAGLQLATIEDTLPRSRFPMLEPDPSNADLLHLWGRRATFEYVLRRHVARLPNVRFVDGVKVSGLIAERQGQHVVVRGVEYRDGKQRELLEVDMVVDASGKQSKLPEALRSHGARVELEHQPSEFMYSCRHYRFNDPANEPPRTDDRGNAAGGNFDFLGFATFYGEHGHYSLAFGCPLDELEVSHAIRRPEGYDALCQQLPVIKQMTSASTALTKVLGAGRFENRWHDYRAPRGRELLHFFAVGDSHIETNPMYGRGCAAAFVQAEVLADTLLASQDPARRARQYYARTRALIRPFYDLSVQTDRHYRTRARLKRGLPVAWFDRFTNQVFEYGWLPATYTNPWVARQYLKVVQMCVPSSNWHALLCFLYMLRASILVLLGRGPSPTLTPARSEFLARLAADSADPPTQPHGQTRESAVSVR